MKKLFMGIFGVIIIIFELTKLPARLKLIWSDIQLRSQVKTSKEKNPKAWFKIKNIPCVISPDTVRSQYKHFNVDINQSDFYSVPVYTSPEVKFVAMTRLPNDDDPFESVAFNRALIQIEQGYLQKLRSRMLFTGKINDRLSFSDELNIDITLCRMFDRAKIVDFLKRERQMCIDVGGNPTDYTKRIEILMQTSLK